MKKVKNIKLVRYCSNLVDVNCSHFTSM